MRHVRRQWCDGRLLTVGPVANQTYETLPLSQNVALNAGGSATVECADYTSNAATSFYDGGITATLINSSTGNAPRISPQDGTARTPASPLNKAEPQSQSRCPIHAGSLGRIGA